MIQPTVYQKKLEGKSNAHLITFSDGKDYVVKYFQPGFEKSLPNEWVAYCLARYLGLPIPYAQLVEIPQDFSSQVPELAQMGHTNFQFASLYVPDCVDAHQVSNVSKIINHQSLAGIILFDYWLCNGDRTRKNILLHEENLNSYQLWVIDHAEIFGSYNWLQHDLEMLPIGILKSATHKLMALFIEDEKQFTEQLELIQTMPILLIEEIVALIPDDWGVSMEEKKGMVTTLLSRRKNILPKLVQKVIQSVYRPLHQNQG
ncbi:HipA family kinase [Peribacillus sp. NPDC096540]|uniref:HipA family kinase n=1 Tax=Peribacillus sp. NPDC096540 TaxID=3390612 RepID=UPI003CFDEFE3